MVRVQVALEADMGTRNLTIIFYKGEYKLAQYGQWDGYPSGQGLTVLKFARDTLSPYLSPAMNAERRKQFLDNLEKCRQIEPEKLQKMWREAGADEKTGMIAYDKAREFGRKHPQLDRDLAAEVLKLIDATPSGLEINKDLEFAGASLYCEWAYVLDFDANTFEVYKGFNKEPLAPTERFAFLPVEETKNIGPYSNCCTNGT